jgi:hypothetical protein
MIRGFSRRGQPLLALTLLLGSWVSARAMMWDAAAIAPPQPLPPLLQISQPEGGQPITAKLRSVQNFTAAQQPRIVAAYSPIPVNFARSLVGPREISAHPAPRLARHVPQRIAASAPSPRSNFVAAIPESFDLTKAVASPRSRLIGPGEMSRLPEFVLVQPTSGVSVPEISAGPAQGQSDRRWSVDSWLLWRRGGDAPPGGILTPRYGASQAGMVLRYRLSPHNSLRPTAYLRTTTALNGSGEREAAMGLSARPFAGMPFIVAGEARLTGTSGGYVLRPAAFLVTELPPFTLPMALRGEAYGQAGYVGGRFATAFADGQFRMDRRLLALGRGDLRFGGGLWGGAQTGAVRLDTGPSLAFGQPVGKSGGLRLTADWRFRVAGNAAPASGPAVTLSAGF